VRQNIRRHVANCFVAVDIATRKVGGCYTISAAGIPLVDLSREEIRK